jgi:ATP sulfurylase
MLQSGKHPPKWFMRKEISQLVINEIKNGKEIFIS